MRYELRIRYDAGAAGTGELLLADGRSYHLDADDVARINAATAQRDGGSMIAAILAEREATAVQHG